MEYPNGFKTINKFTLGCQQAEELTRLFPSHLTICEWQGQYPTCMDSCTSKPTTLCEICMGLLQAKKPMCCCVR